MHDGKAADNSADTATIDDTIAVTVSVTNVEEAGAVTFGSDAPRAGRGSRSDAGRSRRRRRPSLVWTWTRLDTADSPSGMPLTGATGSGLESSYTPVVADVGKWLRASASYTDTLGPSKAAAAVTAAAVAAKPSVSTIAVTSAAGSDDTYAVGDVIAVTVTFTETIAVTGTPTLKIQVGTAERTANCARHTSEHARLVCSYTVASGDSDTDGIEVKANKLAGSIKKRLRR